MKKLSKKQKILTAVIILIFAVIIFFIENDVKPYSIEDNTDVFDFVPVNGTEFQSEDLKIGNKTAFIYSVLSEGTSVNGNDEYLIVIGNVRGVNNNRYEMSLFAPQVDEDVLSPKYVNVFDVPQYEIKKGNSYLGSIYVGTVPIDCKSVEIQGKQATLVEQSFELNGKQANFYLYYCAVEENEYPDSVSVVCENNDGEKVNIQTKKY